MNYWMFIYHGCLDDSCQNNPNDYRVDFSVFAAVALAVIEFQSENRNMSQPNLFSQEHRDYSSFTHTKEMIRDLLLQNFYWT